MEIKKRHTSGGTASFKSVGPLLFSLLVAAATVLALFSGTFLPVGAADSDPVDVSGNTSDELPPLFSPDEDMYELEDLYTEDSNGCLHGRNGAFDYYYLKGDYETAYMSFPFQAEQEGTYEICIALMTILSSVPRSAEISINGESRYYIERDYRDVPDGVSNTEYVSGITAYLRKGTNVLTVYLGSTFDNVSMKSLFFDKFFFYRTGDLPAGYVFPDSGEGEQVDTAGATPDRILFNRNFRSLVSSTVFCSAGYVTDEEKGEVLELTVSENLEPFRFAFSYSKYMRLLGLDPETDTCDTYLFAVLAVRADADLIDGNVNFFYFTAGSDVLDFGKVAEDSFDNDGNWQYVLFDMEMESGWYADLKGGTIFFGSGGSEPGTKLRIAELSLFKTYEEAAKYAGFIPDGTTEKETATVTEQMSSDDTDAPTDKPVSDTASAGDAAASTAAQTGSAGGCRSAVSGGVLLCLLPAAWIPQRRRRAGKR